MPRRLYLVRHGETEANRLRVIQGQNKQLSSNPNTYGDPLNSNGTAQARRLGKALADVKFQFIYTSPARRAIDTANTIFSYNKDSWNKLFLENTLIIENGLLEIDQGAFEGITGNEIKTKYPELYSLYHTKPSQFTFPGGESMIEAKERVGRAIDRIIHDRFYFEENILAVSHGGAIDMAFIHIFGLDMDRMYHAIRHHNCAFSIIEWPSPNALPRIECLNNASHLK